MQWLGDFSLTAYWEDDADGPALKQWADESYAALRPLIGPEVYQNVPDLTLSDWATAYYGGNLERLVRVKRVWDPENYWHFPQSLPLSYSPVDAAE